MHKKHLYRSGTNKVLAGICGGLGEYFDIDPVVIRFFWIILTVFTGLVPGVLAYLFAVFVIPPHP